MKKIALTFIWAMALGTLVYAAGGSAPQARAAALVVDRTDDPDPTVETTADDCTGAANDCTLRGAIIAANTADGADVITLPAGDYVLTSTGSDANGGDLNITTAMTINGAGADTTTIDGVASTVGNRVMEIVCICAVDISGVTIRGGRLLGGTPSGGGLNIGSATVRLDGVHITDNQATEDGTGVGAGAGGIAVVNAILTITNSTISANTAGGSGFSDGGGIRNVNSTLTLRNSTVSGNTSSGTNGSFAGGLRLQGGTTELVNVTVSNNTAANAGAGVSPASGTLILRNTILAQNNGDNCSGNTPGSAGNNLSDDTSCNDVFNELSDLEDQGGPHLAALGGNGGPTPTHALLTISPAMDGGSNTVCGAIVDAFDTADTTDQRGELRTQDGDGNGTATCDIGAFEGDQVIFLCNGLEATIGDHSGAITGTGGDDVIVGDNGANTIDGGGGNDTICALGNNDTVVGGSGVDNIFGGTGVDTVSYSSAAGAVTVNLANGSTNQGDTLNGVENVKGSPAGDTITGNASSNKLEGFGGNDNLKGGGGADNLSGGLGDDTINGGAGADNLNGGSGKDTLSYAGSPAVTITLGGANNAGDTVALFENVVGSSNADSITGNTGANVISGGGGNDTLNGGAGNDTINGGGGQDTINGGGPTSLPGDKCRGDSNPTGQQDVLTNCEDSIA